MMRAVALTLLLAGCAAPVAPQVPARLQVCPDPVYAPVPPPSPRTVAQLFRWGSADEIARQKTEAARRECATRLDELNSWILQHMKTMK